MLLKQNALIGICAAVYLLVWLALACAYQLHQRRSKEFNLQTSVMLYSGAVFVRRAGWIGAIILWLVLSFALPTVEIVSQDPQRRIAQEKEMAEKYDWYTPHYDFTDHQTFFCDRYYFPFRYNGKWFPNGKYIHNTTDSTLNIFKTTVWDTGYRSVDGDDEGIFIAPGEMSPLKVSIDSKFEAPSKYLKKNQMFKETWTLDTKEYAKEQKGRILYEIKEKQKEVYKILKPWESYN